MDEGLKDETDDDAMRVLRDALAIEPSPGFEDRVRAAIVARENAPRTLRRSWIPAAAAAVLAAALGLVVARARRLDPPPAVVVGTIPATPHVGTIGPSPAAPSVPAPAIPGPRAQRAAVASPAASVRRPARPVVPSGEAERIVRYALLTRSHPLAEDPFARSAPVAPLVPPASIAIAPVEIEPIDKEEGSSR